MDFVSMENHACSLMVSNSYQEIIQKLKSDIARTFTRRGTVGMEKGVISGTTSQLPTKF